MTKSAKPKELRAIEKACKAYAHKYRDQCVICVAGSPSDNGMLNVNGGENDVRHSIGRAIDEIRSRYAAAREQATAATTAQAMPKEQQ